MLKGGGGWGRQHFEVVLTQDLEVLAIVKGVAKRFPPFKRGGGAQKVFPCLKGGEAQTVWTRDFPIVPPST